MPTPKGEKVPLHRRVPAYAEDSSRASSGRARKDTEESQQSRVHRRVRASAGPRQRQDRPRPKQPRHVRVRPVPRTVRSSLPRNYEARCRRRPEPHSLLQRKAKPPQPMRICPWGKMPSQSPTPPPLGQTRPQGLLEHARCISYVQPCSPSVPQFPPLGSRQSTALSMGGQGCSLPSVQPGGFFPKVQWGQGSNLMSP